MAVPLPDRDEFLANRFVQITECNICYEDFTSQHIAVQFLGHNTCRHVFGEECIKGWMQSRNRNANRCPMCLCVLFTRSTHEAMLERIDQPLTGIQLAPMTSPTRPRFTATPPTHQNSAQAVIPGAQRTATPRSQVSIWAPAHRNTTRPATPIAPSTGTMLQRIAVTASAHQNVTTVGGPATALMLPGLGVMVPAHQNTVQPSTPIASSTGITLPRIAAIPTPTQPVMAVGPATSTPLQSIVNIDAKGAIQFVRLLHYLVKRDVTRSGTSVTDEVLLKTIFTRVMKAFNFAEARFGVPSSTWRSVKAMMHEMWFLDSISQHEQRLLGMLATVVR